MSVPSRSDLEGGDLPSAGHTFFLKLPGSLAAKQRSGSQAEKTRQAADPGSQAEGQGARLRARQPTQ